MSDHYEKCREMEAQGKLRESEAIKIKAEADLRIAQSQPFVPGGKLPELSRHTAEFIKGAGVIIGPAAVIHFIWAMTVVAVTWILVVKGWRGGPL